MLLPQNLNLNKNHIVKENVLNVCNFLTAVRCLLFGLICNHEHLYLCNLILQTVYVWLQPNAMFHVCEVGKQRNSLGGVLWKDHCADHANYKMLPTPFCCNTSSTISGLQLAGSICSDNLPLLRHFKGGHSQNWGLKLG